MVRLIGGNVVANHNSYPEIMNERGVEKSHWYWLESLLVLVKHLYVVKSPCQESPVQHQQPTKEAHTHSPQSHLEGDAVCWPWKSHTQDDHTALTLDPSSHS